MSRVFKTRWFARAARKAAVDDAALCSAIAQAMQGQADDLGGGVYKKRLNKNRHRSIILARGSRYWVYVFLFAKQGRASIDDGELVAFRALAAIYAAKSDTDIARELATKELIEICHA